MPKQIKMFLQGNTAKAVLYIRKGLQRTREKRKATAPTAPLGGAFAFKGHGDFSSGILRGKIDRRSAQNWGRILSRLLLRTPYRLPPPNERGLKPCKYYLFRNFAHNYTQKFNMCG